MFQYLTRKINRDEWCRRDSRWVKLDNYDRLLDGTIYDHLQHSFYEESGSGDEPIPIQDRRPSAQFRLCRWVAYWSTRKLLAGRHQPRLIHPDDALEKSIRTLARSSKFWQALANAIFYGSVGSVALTFRVNDDDRVAFAYWRSKFCEPGFDRNGELAKLRVRYVTFGSQLLAMGAPSSSIEDPAGRYWFIRDWDTESEVTYLPVRSAEWNPVDGFVGPDAENRSLQPWEDEVYEHKFGFVPGQWFVNLYGGDAPDGAATFGDAIPNAIDMDYTLSQLGRGVRYNAAPQLTITGEIRNPVVTRGPMSYIHLEAARKTEDGETMGGGSANLLEMNGSGVEAGLKFLEFLRNLALEQIAASRKDPEKIKGPLSGRAMEYLEEDSSDLIMELRTQYGELGGLPLLRKVLVAANVAKEGQLAELNLQWPRLFQPTPGEMAQLIPALRDAVTPIVDPATTPQRGAGGGARPTTTVSRPNPSVAPQVPEVKTIGSLMTVPQAQAFIAQALDLAMLDERAEDTPAEITDPATEVNTDAPAPTDPVPDAGEPEGATPGSEANKPEGGPIQASRETFGMNVGPRVSIDV